MLRQKTDAVTKDQLLPLKAEFEAYAEKYRMAPLCRDLGIWLDPLRVFKSLRLPNSFLLHSSMAGEWLSRYSFLSKKPFLIFTSKGRQVNVEYRDGQGDVDVEVNNPLDTLKGLLDEYRGPFLPNVAPFLGGAVGYIGYDIVRFLEKISLRTEDSLGVPDIYMMFADSLLVFDHLNRSIVAVASGEVFEECAERVLAMESEVKRISLQEESPTRHRDFIHGAVKSNFTKSDYLRAVSRVKAYIMAGDTYQVNLSQRLLVETLEDPLPIYERLTKINPSPFAAYLDLVDFQILSSSPERLVRLRGNTVTTRPIAGTRPRGKSAEEDISFEKELCASEKERAEHTMLVDLARNDIGKVCNYGSVKVTEFMTVERYARVMHLASNVQGRLKQGKDRFDVLKAVFPGGTITGCPKIRTMEIIDELEPCRRGPFYGSIGYLAFSGNMDMNIAIRTAVVKDGKAYFQVGGGIVADSDPEREYAETLSKAQAIIEALG